MKSIRYIRGLLIGAVLLGGSACRKELCYDHNHVANVNVNLTYNLDWYTHWQPGVSLDPDWEIEWNVVSPQEPSGVRVITYPHYAGLSGYTYNLPKTGGKLNMTVGLHDLLFYNNDTESIIFSGKGEETKVTTNTRTRASYSEMYPDELTLTTPDMLFAAFYEDLQIEDGALEYPNVDVKNVDVLLKPRVFSYVIRYEFKHGIEYVSKARGALTNMSASVYLSSGHTDDDPATLLFDCYAKEWGCETVIRSFGVPGIVLHEPEATASAKTETSDANKVIEIKKEYAHRLTLELYLKNGKEKQIEIDVTDQVNKQPRGGVIVVKGIEVSDEEGAGDGGFDTSVDGWEDDQIIEVPID